MADALIAKQLDFTDRDFDSLQKRLENLVRSVFPDWTDFNTANFGNILLRLFAFVGDVDNFYLDNLARESRILTVTQRRNMIALGKLINFELAGATAASADGNLTLVNGPLAGDLSLPAGTLILTRSATSPVTFQLLSPITILAGFVAGVGVVENSGPADESFLSAEIPNQTFRLGETPFLDGSLLITAGNGVYTEVDDFLNSTSTDLHFTVEVDQNDRATVRFGDGTTGAIPTGTITFDYKTGGGTVGNVDANTITEIEGSFTDSLGNPAELAFTNPVAASGGVDRQTIAQARILAPLSLRVLERTVTRDDYEIGALLVPGVARALMLTSNEDVTVAENTGDLYVIAEGGSGIPSTELKDKVLIAVTVTRPNTLTFVVTIVDPIFKTITVDATVFLSEGASAAVVKKAIEDNLAAFFAVTLADGTPNPNVDFGFNIKNADGTVAAELAWSDVFNVIRDTTGVRKLEDDLELDGVVDDIALLNNDFPKLGTITLTNGDTMGPL